MHICITSTHLHHEAAALKEVASVSPLPFLQNPETTDTKARPALGLYGLQKDKASRHTGHYDLHGQSSLGVCAGLHTSLCPRRPSGPFHYREKKKKRQGGSG